MRAYHKAMIETNFSAISYVQHRKSFLTSLSSNKNVIVVFQ